MNLMNKCTLLLACSLFSTSYLFAEEPSIAVGVGYETKYVSEGRNNLEEGGLVTSTLAVEQETGAGTLGGEIWYGSSEDTPYTEFNAAFAWAYSLTEGVDLVVGYTYLAFLKDDEDDNEISLELSTGLGNGLSAFVAGTYSVVAEGTFWEVGAGQELRGVGYSGRRSLGCIWSEFRLCGRGA